MNWGSLVPGVATRPIVLMVAATIVPRAEACMLSASLASARSAPAAVAPATRRSRRRRPI
jgi:hypothetical protein